MATQVEPAGSVEDAPKSKFSYIARALNHRNFRLFFSGQSISLIGTWMTRVATSWLVYRLTHSALLLGLVGFAGQIPTFILAPVAGVLVDRMNRHRVLVITQVVAMLQSFALAALALSGRVTITHILWLSVVQGLVNAFDMPARQTFMIEMVEDRADLGNAIALNSSMVNMARLVGPSLAGIVIAAVGEGYCFFIDGVSYIAVIASLMAMRLTIKPVVRKAENVLVELKEGWSYVSSFVPIRSILLLLALISLVGMPYTILMPIFAANILKGGPHTLGFLMGASGVGALVSAFRLAARKSVVGLGRIVGESAIVFGVGIMLFAYSRTLWLSIPLMFVTGFGMMQQMASSNTILQTIVDEGKRGRVMSYYTMAFAGMAPFGSLLAGSVASRIGAPNTLMFSGIACVAGGAWYFSHLPTIRKFIRPIYVELGIVPEIAKGIEAAAVLTSPPED